MSIVKLEEYEVKVINHGGYILWYGGI